MKRVVIFTPCLCVLAVPCLLDVTSTEPSPLVATFAALGAGDWPTFQPPSRDRN